jgi:hypothetical protein
MVLREHHVLFVVVSVAALVPKVRPPVFIALGAITVAIAIIPVVLFTARHLKDHLRGYRRSGDAADGENKFSHGGLLS